jgi:hypothetical protein
MPDYGKRPEALTWTWRRAQIDFICPVCNTDGGCSQATWHIDANSGWYIQCPSGCSAEAILDALYGEEFDTFKWLAHVLAELPHDAALSTLGEREPRPTLFGS